MTQGDSCGMEVNIDISLTMEQRFSLRTLAMELQELSRDELIERVLEEREDYLLQQRFFKAILEDQGAVMEEEADFSLVLPETEEEMIAVFGHIPTHEEYCAYVEERVEAHQEAARIDVDIEAIALGLEE